MFLVSCLVLRGTQTTDEPGLGKKDNEKYLKDTEDRVGGNLETVRKKEKILLQGGSLGRVTVASGANR